MYWISDNDLNILEIAEVILKLYTTKKKAESYTDLESQIKRLAFDYSMLDSQPEVASILALRKLLESFYRSEEIPLDNQDQICKLSSSVSTTLTQSVP